MLWTQSNKFKFKFVYWYFLSFDIFDVFFQPYFFAINLYHFRITLKNIDKSIPVARWNKPKAMQHKVAKKSFIFIVIQVHMNRPTLMNYFKRIKTIFF